MRRVSWAVTALLVLSLGQGASRSDAASPWLVVDSPRAANSTADRALLEIGGHGGERRGGGHDLVIVIDVSESTLEDSGIDLDHDGAGGRTAPDLLEWIESATGDERLWRRLQQQDFDDTVLAAELEAARALVDRLDPTRFRVGLVAFAEDARTIAPLGSPSPVLDLALRDLRQGFHLEKKGTNFASAVERAHAMLRPEPDVIDDRLRSIVFLSDGAPTRPVYGDRAERYALSAALQAGADGVRLFAFAIGSEAEAGLAVMRKMAGWTSGRLEQVTYPGRIVAQLRKLDLVGLAEVTVVNQTTGSAARALRTFPDGTFDGFVELATGANRLRFEARGEDGRVHQVERVVTFRPSVGAGAPGAPAPADPLIGRLRERTDEIEAWNHLEQERADALRQRRELELRAETPGE